MSSTNSTVLDLVMDEAGNLHALLDRYVNPKIAYASRVAGSQTWTTNPIISLDRRGGVSHPLRNVLGLDDQGKVHVGYSYLISSDDAGLSGVYLRYAEPCP